MLEPLAGSQAVSRIRGVDVEQVARHIFERQAATFDSDAALLELAWLDDDVRTFWVAEATSVITYISRTAA